MEEANKIVIKDTLKEIILKKANAHAAQYVERYQRVAYDSYLAGMEEMSKIMADHD